MWKGGVLTTGPTPPCEFAVVVDHFLRHKKGEGSILQETCRCFGVKGGGWLISR